MKNTVKILIFSLFALLVLFLAVALCHYTEVLEMQKNIVSVQLQQEKEKAKYYETLTKTNEKQAEYYSIMIQRLRSEN